MSTVAKNEGPKLPKTKTAHHPDQPDLVGLIHAPPPWAGWFRAGRPGRPVRF
jgi:hypothetical protein